MLKQKCSQKLLDQTKKFATNTLQSTYIHIYIYKPSFIVKQVLSLLKGFKRFWFFLPPFVLAVMYLSGKKPKWIHSGSLYL